MVKKFKDIKIYVFIVAAVYIFSAASALCGFAAAPLLLSVEYKWTSSAGQIAEDLIIQSGKSTYDIEIPSDINAVTLTSLCQSGYKAYINNTEGALSISTAGSAVAVIKIIAIGGNILSPLEQYTINLNKNNTGNILVTGLSLGYSADGVAYTSLQIADFNSFRYEYYISVPWNTKKVLFTVAKVSGASVTINGASANTEFNLSDLTETEFIINAVSGVKSSQYKVVVIKEEINLLNAVKTVAFTAKNDVSSRENRYNLVKGTGTYKFSVPYTANKIKFDYEMYGSDNTQLFLNGTAAGKNVFLDFTSSEATFTVKDNGNVICTFIIQRETALQEKYLTGISINAYSYDNRLLGDYMTGFDKNTTNYNLDISLTAYNAKISLDTKDLYIKSAEITANGVKISQNTFFRLNNTSQISILITGENNESVTYNLTLIKQISVTPIIKSADYTVTDTGGNILTAKSNINFSASSNVTVTVPKSSDRVFVNCQMGYAVRSIEMSCGGVAYDMDTGIAAGQTLQIKVIGESGTKTYNVSFVKAAALSDYINLNGIWVETYSSFGVKTANYSSAYYNGRSEYAFDIPVMSDKAVITLEKTNAAMGLSAKLNGTILNADTKGAASTFYISLTGASTIVEVTLKSEIGTLKTFNIMLNRESSLGKTANIKTFKLSAYSQSSVLLKTLSMTDIDVNNLYLPSGTSYYNITCTADDNASCELLQSGFLYQGGNITYIPKNNAAVTVQIISEDRSLSKDYSYTVTTNNYLKELKVNGVLVSNFSRGISSYNMSVMPDVSSIAVTAAAEDNSSAVSITGNTQLGYGDNIFSIAVTSWDGAVRLYTLTVTKQSPGITSSSLVINKTDHLISGLAPPMTAADFLSKISANSTTVQLYDKNNSIYTGSNVATGMKVKVIYNAQVLEEYTIILYGDANGDGRINSADVAAIVQHGFKINLSGAYLIAANANRGADNKVNAADIMAVVYHGFGRLINQG